MKTNDDAARAGSSRLSKPMGRRLADWLRRFWAYRDDPRDDLEVYDWDPQPKPEALPRRAGPKPAARRTWLRRDAR